MPSTTFLLSPAHCGGKRAGVLLRAAAPFDLAQRLRSPAGAPLGEVFAFLSGLYFRGKLAYAVRFADPAAGAAWVITTNRGLMSPHAAVGAADLAAFGEGSIDPRDPRYRVPLEEDVARLAAGNPGPFVLLGSVATPKYVGLLLDALGDRLLIPEAFPGMGDMQRGALLLRAAREGAELPYVPVRDAVLSRAARRVGG